jgi:hypothetical protein
VIPTLVLWAAATLLHFALTARATGRVLSRDPHDAASLDERVFAAALGGVASLSIMLHVVAVFVGLSLGAGVGALIVWHAALWRATRRPAAGPTDGLQPATTFLEFIALGVGATIVLTWVGLAAQSADALGPDAAHYHVPHAVNFAAGASPFDLPATPHLYPMAGSMVAAWFIVPLGNPLIADLAMALPFVLLVAALNLLFRCATGLSGTAWATWLSILLFSTPMFRMGSHGAADLWFASAFACLVAVVVLIWTRRRWTALDVVLGGCAVGLLVGTKSIGAPAAALIAGAVFVVWIARRVFGAPRIGAPNRAVWPFAIAAAAAVAAGGIWLVRNWWQFGSPLAPAGLSIAGLTIFDGESFQRSKYLSVLAEMDTDSFHLWPRTRFFVGQWFGSWFLAALLPIGVLVLDLAAGMRRHARDAHWWPRVGLLVITVVAGAALIWMLIGAPWSGMERSRGLTLRYALPIAALLPLLAYAGWFPLTLPWYRHGRFRTGAAAIVIAASIALFLAAARDGARSPMTLIAPGIDWRWLPVGLAAVWLAGRAVRGGWGIRAGACAGLIALAAWWAPTIARQDRQAREVATDRLNAEDAAPAEGLTNTNVWREVHLVTRVAERGENRRCGARRFFSLVRFDEPLALQPARFGNQVFYAGRDVDAARRAGPIGPCDYVITSPAVAATDKGQALASALAGARSLRTFASTRDFVVLSVDPN